MNYQFVILALSGAAVLLTAAAVGVFLLNEKIQKAKAAKMTLEADQQA